MRSSVAHTSGDICTHTLIHCFHAPVPNSPRPSSGLRPRGVGESSCKQPLKICSVTKLCFLPSVSDVEGNLLVQEVAIQPLTQDLLKHEVRDFLEACTFVGGGKKQ